MNRISANIRFMVLGLLSLAAAGCSDALDAAGGEMLPVEHHPLELASQMTEMSLTRSTTDNSWSGGEEIAVKVDGAVRLYTAAALDGKLTAKASINEPFYWTKASEVKVVSAFYPYSLANASSLSVSEDQSGSGYLSSDALFAPPTSMAFSDVSKSLTFHHLPVKVVVNLKNGDGVTATEVEGATVTFVNQRTYASFDNATGIVTPASPGSSIVQPTVLPTPSSGFQKSLQALLVPCQMQGTPFIKVTIGSESFYYTPTGATDANLSSGNVHAYEITVKRTGIDVKINQSLYWSNGSNIEVVSTNLPAKVGDYYYSDKTYSTALKPDKTCIGVVFWIDGAGHGKIVSLDEPVANWNGGTNVAGKLIWGLRGTAIGTADHWDGATNMATVKAWVSANGKTLADLPPFKWCDDKGAGWYLPARSELQTLYYVVTTVNAALGSLYTPLNVSSSYANTYWSSSEGPTTNDYNKVAAYSVLLGGYNWPQMYKTDYHFVRAIRAF